MSYLTDLPEISVIIPVYNIEKYLERALKSLMFQTFKNIEIICVDDGSTDNSGSICRSLAKKDSRIKVIQREHHGTGAARNAGITAAAGKYISFVDGDDWLHPNFLEVLYRLCEDNGCDIAQCGLALVWSENGNNEAAYCEAVIVKGSDMALRNFMPGDGWRQIIVCNKLYRRDLLANIKFPQGKKHEDEFFTHKVLWNAHNVAVTECPLYYYRQHSDSAMGIGFTIEKTLDFIEAFEEKADFYKSKDTLLFYRANLMFDWCLRNYLKELQRHFPEREDVKTLLQEKLQKVSNSIKLLDSEGMRKADLDQLRLRNLQDTEKYCFDLENIYNESSDFKPGVRKRSGDSTKTKVSVCIPVRNAEHCLADCLDSVINQTLKDIEIICIEDASADKSKELLETYAVRDSRIKVISHKKRLGMLVTRKEAVSAAQGKYIMFVDCDGSLFPNACEIAYKVISQNQTDVAEYSVKVMGPPGEKTLNYLELNAADRLEDKNILHLRMQKHLKNCTVWNKIYRAELIKEAFFEIENDCSVSGADFLIFCVISYYAKSVSLIKEELYKWKWNCGSRQTVPSVIGLGRFKELLTEKDELDAVLKFISTKPDKEEYRGFLQKIREQVLHQAISWWNESLDDKKSYEWLRLFVEKWGAEETAKALQWLLSRLKMKDTAKEEKQFAQLNHMEDIMLSNNTGKTVLDDFESGNRGDENIRHLVTKQIIVSITSYPARIHEAVLAIRTIYRQTKLPDKVILWLGEEKFPNKFDDLPEELLQLMHEKNLEIRWCEDIGPHTKYYYAFKEYPDALVVTIDDDILYPPDRIENLYRCYLRFPYAVSAGRADFVPISEHEEMPPVTIWPEEVDAWVLQPSMQLYAMGVNCVLYPTILFSQVSELLDKETIRRICPYADDLWLKAMEAVAGIPVVVSEPDQPLPISTEESQETALWHYNCVDGGNNVQWKQIEHEIDARYGKGFLRRKLLDKSVGKDLTGSQGLIALARYFQRKAWKLQDKYAKYYTLRLDIKNNGGEDCNLVERIITPKAFSVRKPEWLPNGVTIESRSERMKIVVQCEGDGELEIDLLGRDLRNAKKKRFPVWIDCTYFTVNGEAVFEGTKTVCYDKKFVYKRPVSDGERLEIELKWTECRSSFTADTFKKLEIEKKKAKKLERELDDIKNGWSFKIGRVITFIPRKVRDFLT